jgi:hypothetical protein
VLRQGKAAGQCARRFKFIPVRALRRPLPYRST